MLKHIIDEAIKAKGQQEQVRAMKVESGMQVMITKEKFSEFLVSETAIKLTDEFEMNIKDVDYEWITVQFRSKNDTSDWNRFVDVTDLFIKAMKN